MVEPVCEKFQLWKGAGMPIKILRMDNSGENKKLQQRLESSDWELNPEIEYTARATPQHNARAELLFPSIANKRRAMMSAANLPIYLA